ncbi:MAG: phasin family protein [Alteraurantiacibacter sp.]
MADKIDSDATVAKVEAAPAVETPPVAPEAVAAPAPEPVATSVKVATAKPKPAEPVTPAAAVPAPKTKQPVQTRKSPIAKPKVAARRKIVAPRKPPARSAATSNLSVTELKEKIMATKTSSFTSPLAGDFTQLMGKSMSDAVAEMQTKAQTAYDKGTTLVGEMTDLAKGNAEAVVESGKILAAGLQDLGKSYAEDAKSSYETITADFKEMAAIKSPTELFQLQGKIMRRNFDALVAATSKGTETGMKLANEAIAPLTARVNLAVEKLSKAA